MQSQAGSQGQSHEVTTSKMEDALAKRTGEKCNLNDLICKAVQLMDTHANEDVLRDITGRIQKQLELFTHIHSEYVDFVQNRDSKINEQRFYDDVASEVKRVLDMLVNKCSEEIKAEDSVSQVSASAK